MADELRSTNPKRTRSPGRADEDELPRRCAPHGPPLRLALRADVDDGGAPPLLLSAGRSSRISDLCLTASGCARLPARHNAHVSIWLKAVARELETWTEGGLRRGIAGWTDLALRALVSFTAYR